MCPLGNEKIVHSQPRRRAVDTMNSIKFLGVFALIFCVSPSLQYDYKVKTFDTKLDHFTFTTNATFKLRYLINDSWWDPTLTTSPIFFYTGNEGDITLFSDNAGLVWEWAPDFNALVVFAEHRYYGESLPFGNLSFTDPKYSGYLSSLQALADYVDLIAHLKTVYSKRDNAPIPVIAFGGSYGGMLAAWIRMKYPGIITGSLAASAPIWQFTGMTPCDAFYKVTTRAFKVSGSQNCVDTIKNSWGAIDSIAASDGGLQWISQTFKTCGTLTDKVDLKNYLNSAFVNAAMANYPYPANFLAELPGHPVKAICKKLSTTSKDPKVILESIFQGVSVFFNYTGTSKCLQLDDADPQDLGDQGWGYQSCTEMVMPICDRGDTMFEKSEWDMQTISDSCYAQYKVRPVVDYVRNLYGAKELAYVSNIIFSNGYLDPWSSGGVLHSVSKDSMVTGAMQGAAHHLDLRASNPLDPPSVKRARQMYRKLMNKWVREIL
uniref:Lysosomal Pro-X carboxypeptidase n=1 Tax=Lygus hesperus TaxID=30085 RepID=A0A0A9WII6_LYGHE